MTLGIAFPGMTRQRILTRKISLFFRYHRDVLEVNMSQDDGPGQGAAAVKTEAAVSRDSGVDDNGDDESKGQRL